MNGSRLDRVIGIFSPKAELARVRARATLDLVRKYEGAGKGKRTKNWFAQGTDANSEIFKDLETLRNRARDLDRNNPWCKRANDIVAAYTVGTGISPQAKCDDPKIAERIDRIWKEWAETPAIDPLGRRNFYGLQFAVARNVASSGEVLINPRIVPSAAGIPLQVLLLEGDHIDHHFNGLNYMAPNGNRIVCGIEFDQGNIPVAYWIFPQHPGNPIGIWSLKPVRVPASDLWPIFREDRIGQLRGVPWAAPSMIRLKDLDEYEDAQLMRQKIAAMFAVFLKNVDENSSGTTKRITETVNPGAIYELPLGLEAQFGSPPSVEGHSDYIKTVLRSIAMAYGITYESLTGDLSGVNFSSGRMGRIDFRANVNDWRDRIIITQFCEPIWKKFLKIITIKYGIDTSGVGVDWTAPKWEYLDPVKEAQGTLIQIRSGEKTLQQVIKENGRDFLEHLKEISNTNKLLDEMGIRLDSDPRKDGTPAVAGAGEGNGGGNNADN